MFIYMNSPSAASETSLLSLICKVTSDQVTQVKGLDLESYGGIKDGPYQKGDTINLDYYFSSDKSDTDRGNRFSIEMYNTFKEVKYFDWANRANACFLYFNNQGCS